MTSHRFNGRGGNQGWKSRNRGGGGGGNQGGGGGWHRNGGNNRHNNYGGNRFGNNRGGYNNNRRGGGFGGGGPGDNRQLNRNSSFSGPSSTHSSGPADSRLNTSDSGLHKRNTQNPKKPEAKPLIDYPSDDDDDDDRLKIHEDPSTEEESEKSSKPEEKQVPKETTKSAEIEKNIKAGDVKEKKVEKEPEKKVENSKKPPEEKKPETKEIKSILKSSSPTPPPKELEKDVEMKKTVPPPPPPPKKKEDEKKGEEKKDETEKDEAEIKRQKELLKTLKAARQNLDMAQKSDKEKDDKKEEKVRTMLSGEKTSEKTKEKEKPTDKVAASDSIRAILEKSSKISKEANKEKKPDEKNKDTPPPPPPKKPTDSPKSDIKAKKAISLSAFTKKEESKTSSEKKDKEAKSVQSKMTSFMTENGTVKKDELKKKARMSEEKVTKPQENETKRDTPDTASAKTDKKKEEEPARRTRDVPRRASSQRSSTSNNTTKDQDEKKEKTKTTLMSEDIFDMEVAKARGEKPAKDEKKETAKKSGDSKKRPSVVDSEDETEKPNPKRPRPEGPLSPNSRRMSTSLEQRRNERRKSDAGKRKASADETPASQLELHPSADGRNDFYCWICHKEGEVICCDVCPRVYHEDCMPRVRGVQLPEKAEFFCPECTRIQDAENTATRIESLKNVSVSDLALMLENVIVSIVLPGIEIFSQPVDTTINPTYQDYIFHPMDLGTIKQKVKRREYGSPDAFLADIKWIQHNCCIFNTENSELSVTAKKIVRKAEAQCQEIENCPDCYMGPLKDPSGWFTKPCAKIHPIVWGKLQGYPIWPGKAVGSATRGDPGKSAKVQIDIRFFGQHDRAWVNVKDVYCYSKEENSNKTSQKQKKDFESSIKELNDYAANLKAKYGPLRTFAARTQHSSIFLGGEKPEVPKIPPLTKPSRSRPSLSETIVKAQQLDKTKNSPSRHSSDGDSPPVSPSDPFDFNDLKDDNIDFGSKERRQKESKTEKSAPKTESEKLAMSSNALQPTTRPAKRPRPESPLEKGDETISRRSSRRNTDSPKPSDKDQKTSVPPPPPKTKSTRASVDDSSKNAYSAMEKERKRALDNKKKTSEPRVESPKLKKGAGLDLPSSDFLTNLDRTYPARNNPTSDLGKNALPVQGLPPGILIGNYTDKVMTNITAVFKDVYQEILKSMDGNGHVDALRLEVDRLKWQHEMELNEMKHNHELTVAEIRQSVENEKKNAIEELRKKLEKEKEAAILETKKKQWCANCGKEAVFYCCWNTSYCDYPCQQGHWPQHMTTCSQGQGNQRPT